ncbi:MAG: dephospho-CoA kinase [Candidatus Omnitrophica bacterium]|nr:dephospho-CoA kinase [Candidatus Omnitrophota bacterium]
MLVIGVTGGVGTGKSTVARMFARHGAVVLDADRIAHDLIAPPRPAWRELIRTFGRGVLRGDGTVDRRRMAAVVFRHPALRKRLERIIHPRVMRQIRREIRRLRRDGRRAAVVLDVPLLIETGAHRMVDALVVVTAPPEVQRRRVRRQHGWSNEEINERINAQWKLSAKVALADMVVKNAGRVQATQTQVNRIWKQLARTNSSRSSTSQRSKR